MRAAAEAEKHSLLSRWDRRKSETTRSLAAILACRQVLERVNLVAKSDAAVIDLGETGTGKELIARIDPQPLAAPSVPYACDLRHHPSELVDSPTIRARAWCVYRSGRHATRMVRACRRRHSLA